MPMPIATYHVVSLILDRIHDPPEQQDHARACGDGYPGHKPNKVSIVEMPHTVVDPWTMVIHLEDAFLADPAMM